MTTVLDRRQRVAPAIDDRRIESPAGHAVSVGATPGRSYEWIVAVCECGETAESRIEGIVEAWVRWHRNEAALAIALAAAQPA